jgi:hypothetical protein
MVCLTAGVSPREGDEGCEEASDKTAGALSSHAVYRTGCAYGPSASEITARLMAADAHNDFFKRVHRPYSPLLRI